MPKLLGMLMMSKKAKHYILFVVTIPPLMLNSMTFSSAPKNKGVDISISIEKVADVQSFHYNHWIKDIYGDNTPEIITTQEHLGKGKCMAELDEFDVSYYKFNPVKSKYRLHKKETLPMGKVWENYGNPYTFSNQEGKKLQKLAREKLGWWNGTKAYSTMDFDFDGKLEVYMRLEYDGILRKYNTEPYPVRIWKWNDKEKKFILWRSGRKRLEEFKYVDRTSLPVEINKLIPKGCTIKKVYKGFCNPDNKEKHLIYYVKVTWENRFDYLSMREGRLVLYYWVDNNKLESKILYKNETDDAGYLVNFYVVDLIPPPEPEVILINRFHGGSGGSDRIRIFSVSIG